MKQKAGQTRGTGAGARRIGAWVVALPLLVSCASEPLVEDTEEQDGAPARSAVDVSKIPDAVPKPEPRSRSGNPPSYVVDGVRYHVRDTSSGYVARGTASWYGTKFHGKRTSSGEPYNMYAMSAAHRTLPIPSYVRVTNLRNQRSVVVRVNDRGPFAKNRLIDLSYAAARKLGMVGAGTAPVRVQAIDVNRAEATPDTRGRRPGPEKAGAAAHLYLQVGAFLNRANAEHLRSRLLDDLDLAQVEIHRVERGARPVYRVRIGPLPSVAEANRVAQRLSHHGLTESHVVLD